MTDVSSNLTEDCSQNENDRRRDRSQSIDGARQIPLSNSCTGSGGGGSFKRKNVVFSEKDGSIPEDGENAIVEKETKNGRCIQPSTPLKQ